MKRQPVPQAIWILIVLLPVLLACSLLGSAGSQTAVPDNPVSPTQAPPAKNAPTATSQPLPTKETEVSSEPIRQWAIDTEASSEYGTTDWAAYQALGEPDVLFCEDNELAWASAYADTIDWINLYFEKPVYASEIRIYQTYNPDQVSQVDLIDMQGEYVTVYTSQPQQIDDPCPYILSVSINQDKTLVQGVRVTVDQTVLMNWNEIDAVEIVGIPGEGTPVRPISPAP